jgi:hypothetical protein
VKILTRILITCFIVVLGNGCHGDQREERLSDQEELYNEYLGHRRGEWQQEKLVERDIEIILFLLQQRRCEDCFLTVGASLESDDTREWKNIPEPLRVALLKNAINYRPASEAYFDLGQGGSVKERKSNAPATIRHITIRRWISDTEVVVEDSRSSGPLSGGGSIAVYKKGDGVWTRTKHLSWMH